MKLEITTIFLLFWGFVTGCAPYNATKMPVPDFAETSTHTLNSIPTPTLNLPVLPGTPVPMPNEPITLDNIDQIQELAMWGKGRIKQLAYSPDGKILAVGTTAGIWLYDAETFELLRFIQTDSEILTMAFVPDSTTLTAHLEGNLIGRGGKTVMRWNTATGGQVGHWEVGASNLERVVFAPDGKTLASVLEDGQVGLWELESGRLLATLGVDSDPLYLFSALVFSPDGRLLASEAPDHTIRLWEVETGEIIRILPGHYDTQARVGRLAFSPDGTLLASMEGIGIIKLWEVGSGKLLHTLKGNADELSFSPDSQQLATGGEDAVVQLWDVASGQLLRTYDGHTDRVTKLAFSSDGSMLASTGWDKTVHLWDVEDGKSRFILEGFTDLITDLEISPDGAIYVSNANDKEIQIWDVQTGEIERTLTGHTNDVAGLSLSADGTRLASIQRESFAIWIWNITTNQHIKTLGDQQKIRVLGEELAIALSPNGQLTASSEFEVYDVQTETVKYRLRGHLDKINTLTFSPDNTQLASGSSDSSVILWQTETGELLHQLMTPSLYFDGGLGFSSDSQWIAVGYEDGTIRLWDTATGEISQTLRGSTGAISDVAFSPVGDILATGSKAETGLKFWDIETGRLLHTLEIAPIHVIRFTPDGKLLVLGLRNGTIQIWGIPPR